MGKYATTGQGRQAFSHKNPALDEQGRMECGCKPDEDLTDPQCAGHQAIQALVSHLTEPGSVEMKAWAEERLRVLQAQVLQTKGILRQQMDQRDLLAIAVVESELAVGSVVGSWLGWSKLVVPKLVRWSRAGSPPLSGRPWKEGAPHTASSRPRGSGVPLGRAGGTPRRKDRTKAG
jgi:hypothetical protein